MANALDKLDNKSPAVFDSREFIAPRPILEMYQKISFPSFKVWASLLADITEKEFSDKDQYMPLSIIWHTLDGRLSHKRLGKLLDELQTTLVKKDEFLPQTQERKLSSFTMLGPTEITVNKANDVTSLKYRFVTELLQILKSDIDREKFVIEMRTFISLKGAGGEHAKNLLLYCTPHIHTGATQFIDLDELRLYMGLEDSYVDKNGITVIKTFMRDVLKKGVATLTSNPYVSFDIVKIEKKKDKLSKKTLVRFILTERRSIKSLLSESIDDQRSPIDPNKLRTMLVNFWTENIHNGSASYAPEILEKLLRQFRFVDKYIREFINTDDYNSDPIGETFKIFSIATAVTQLWLDGRLEKQDSKIYNYAYSIFKKPKESQIDSLCQKFVAGAGITRVKQELDSEAKKDMKAQQKYNVMQIDKGLKSYKKLRIKRSLGVFDKSEITELDKEFILKSKQGRFGTWAKKASKDINSDTVEDFPLYNLLTRRTLALYKEWLSRQAIAKGKLLEESLNDFFSLYPDYKRYSVALNIPLEVDFLSFQNLVDSIKNKCNG